jgi:hypothetical protein
MKLPLKGSQLGDNFLDALLQFLLYIEAISKPDPSYVVGKITSKKWIRFVLILGC